MIAHDIISQAQAAGVRLVRFLYCGNDGLIRGKAIPSVHLAQRLQEGIGLPMAMQSFTLLDQLAPGGHGSPVGEVRLLPDTATFAVLPYAPGQARLWCDLLQLDQQPWALCPRYFLQRMLTQAAAHGFQVQAAFENEFYVLREEVGKWQPLDTSRIYSTIGMDLAAPLILDVLDALAAQGMLVEHYHPEHGAGQHEVAIRHTTGLRAADNQLAFRDTVRGVAHQHGLLASFAPKPFLEQAGNGCHLHLSLWDLQGTQNAFYSVRDPWQLSAQGYAFLAGVLAHLPALLALTAPSVNSYRRLQPHVWSAAYRCYGPDNREAAVRLPSLSWQRPMASSRLEFRPCDPSCNPYLALGGLIAAGLDGIARQQHPGPPVLQNPALLESSGPETAPQRVPQTLQDALTFLQRDAVLCTALGPALVHDYLAVKHAEVAAFADQGVTFELAQHLYVY